MNEHLVASLKARDVNAGLKVHHLGGYGIRIMKRRTEILAAAISALSLAAFKAGQFLVEIVSIYLKPLVTLAPFYVWLTMNAVVSL
ncbi:MAG: hypothetical protein RLO01_09100 [Thalassobaculaceae bacterium]|uniref:hypothetical protein n=1 Tax=Roseitalea porphyridii TaxID=1852022 RepID=UPI0032EB2407